MQLRKGLWRSKTLFLKTIKEIKCVLLHHHHHHKRSNNIDPHKPPKPHQIFNLSCCKNNQHENEIHRQPASNNNSYEKNNSFKEAPLEEDIDVKITEKKLGVMRLEMSFGSCRRSVEDYDDTIVKKKPNDDDDDGNDRGRMLVQKMKQLEMIDLNDEDGVLDVQQVIGYYSCLKSPVYVEMVDRFFVDMYSEFFIRRQPSIRGTANNNSSSRRLGPIKL
ncbi:transcription repressor OFP17 [Impatiens glandulifera]|uniref:transcription repressor OFP17 n=1 Tax=Impatiens glandulifera TaxID=253017 RepID=UPI001FB10D70|nr:transcription repressor OFP17 [Impatiens glandulifera]